MSKNRSKPHVMVSWRLSVPKTKFVSRSMWLVARTEDLQRIKKKILENGQKKALKGPKIKISKNKKLRFFLMSQGVLCQKNRFLGQKLWPVARVQTHTQTHTEVLITEYPIEAQPFKLLPMIWAVQHAHHALPNIFQNQKVTISVVDYSELSVTQVWHIQIYWQVTYLTICYVPNGLRT